MSIFDSNPENEAPDPFAATEHREHARRVNPEDLIREMYADIKVLTSSVRPLAIASADYGKRIARIEKSEAKVRGYVAAASALGMGGIVGAFQAWLYKLQNGGH
jgi:hypothetical protein